MTRRPSLWDLQRAEDPGLAGWYIRRFRALEETGQDLVGGARLIDRPDGAAREAHPGPPGVASGRHAAWLRPGHAVVGSTVTTN